MTSIIGCPVLQFPLIFTVHEWVTTLSVVKGSVATKQKQNKFAQTLFSLCAFESFFSEKVPSAFPLLWVKILPMAIECNVFVWRKKTLYPFLELYFSLDIWWSVCSHIGWREIKSGKHRIILFSYKDCNKVEIQKLGNTRTATNVIFSPGYQRCRHCATSTVLW